MSQEPSSNRVSLRDIARRMGVSHSTVSLALRNHSRISEAVRHEVHRLAAELGYQPDPMLTALAHYRRGKADPQIKACVAWLNAWPDPGMLHTFREFQAYWKGASAAAAKSGYRLEEIRIGADISPQRLHQILKVRGINGLLIPPHPCPIDWQDFPWENYSVVRFGRSLHKPATHIVTSDHVANTMLALEKIRELGYPRVGFVTNETDARNNRYLFEAGYFANQRFIPNEDRLAICVINEHRAEDPLPEFRNWLKQEKPDAIFTNVARVPAMLKQAGYRVPEDIGLAVTSIADANADAGIDQHPEEVGRVAFLMLNSLINDGARGIPEIFRQILVEGSWVNGSCLPDRRAAAGS